MGLRHIIFHDFWAKMGSLFLAIMIWHVVSTWQHGEGLGRFTPTIAAEQVTFYSQRVTVVKAPDDNRTFRITPAAVNITLRGPRSLVRQLRNSDLTVYINLSDLGDSPKVRKQVRVFHPPAVAVVQVEPFEVEVERITSP